MFIKFVAIVEMIAIAMLILLTIIICGASP